MTLKLTPQDISKYWEAIKLTLIQAGGIPPEREMEYCNKALENILSGKFQVWVVFDYDATGEQDVYGIGITSIQIDKVFGYKVLYMDSYLGFKPQKPDIVQDGVDDLAEFAKANDCKRLLLSSNNKRMFALARMAGFKEERTVFTKDI